MRSIAQERRKSRTVRHRRIRRRIRGSAEQPRLAIFRSLKHVYAQLIDDDQSLTLCAVSSLETQAREALASEKARLKQTRILGKMLAERAKEKGILKVAFDRGGF